MVPALGRAGFTTIPIVAPIRWGSWQWRHASEQRAYWGRRLQQQRQQQQQLHEALLAGIHLLSSVGRCRLALDPRVSLGCSGCAAWVREQPLEARHALVTSTIVNVMLFTSEAASR